MLIGEVSDPDGTVGDDHFFLGLRPPSPESFDVDPLAELLGGFNGSHIGGGTLIPDGVAFFISACLREHAV